MTSYVLKDENQNKTTAKDAAFLERLKNYMKKNGTYLAVAMAGSNDARQMVDMLTALCEM